MANCSRIVIVDAGETPNRVVSRIRDVTGFSQVKAEWFISQLPCSLIDGLDKQDIVDGLKTVLETAGATVMIQPSKAKLPMMVWHPEYDNLSFVSAQFPPRPYSFSWVLENQLAGMGRPSTIIDIDFLRSIGLDLLVSLTELPLQDPFVSNLDCEILHLPIPDLTRPTGEQIDTAISKIGEVLKGAGRAVVHCGAGMGRTGVILACYLVTLGLSAEEAVNELRVRRPGSVETLDQEQCIKEYEERLRPGGGEE